VFDQIVLFFFCSKIKEKRKILISLTSLSLSLSLQVSSINRVLRNLTSQKELQAHSQATNEVYEKLRQLNGPAWPHRQASWYPNPTFGSIGFPAVPSVSTASSSVPPENGSSQDKKGMNYVV
jgi:hypothetical protein